ncbi:MAG: hypothetical protein WDM77_14785 [Steroidobacteraceae bacterium]
MSAQAQFVERIRKIDADHLEDRMTITDPRNFTAPLAYHPDLSAGHPHPSHGARGLRRRGAQSRRQRQVHPDASTSTTGTARAIGSPRGIRIRATIVPPPAAASWGMQMFATALLHKLR